MLIEFNVTNYLSFKDKQSLNLTTAYNLDDLPQNVIEDELPGMSGIHFVKGAAIYGANASGKTNLLKAVHFMREYVTNSATTMKPGQKTEVVPFLLDKGTSKQPSEFEVVFCHKGVRYQYGFSVDKQQIQSEWLHSFPEGKPRKLFTREYDPKKESYKYTYGAHFKTDRSLEAKTRSNALFLSVGVQFNHSQLMKPYEWFQEHLRVLANHGLTGLSPNFTAKLLLNIPGLENAYTNFLQQADLGIDGIKIKRITADDDFPLPTDISAEMKQDIITQLENEGIIDIKLVHKFSGEDKKIDFDLEVESAGTQRLFVLLGPLLEVLLNGHCLFMDEMEASMHPLLTKMLIRMMSNAELNNKGAQLVFTTHDTTLLDSELLRRDQIWFTEKGPEGGTHLYPLSDYRPRKDESLQKGYLAGRYGAIPFLSGEFTF
ncbi:MAG TPA: ATP-binding protein [Candidatus Hydrogenedentes bacterium]|nr:ATP-binding protein [Candidatus Hydrogenedentota bacterium]